MKRLAKGLLRNFVDEDKNSHCSRNCAGSRDTAATAKARRRSVKLALQILLSAALVAWLFLRVDKSALLAAMRGIDAKILSLCAALLIPNFLLRALRWKLLFDSPAGKIPLTGSLKLLFAGLGLNLFLPAGSGDVLKAYLGYRWTGVKERMLSVSLADKLIALASVSLLGLFACAGGGDKRLAAASILAALPLVVMFALARLGSVPRFIEKRLENRFDLAIFSEHIRSHKNLLLLAAGLSVCGWLVTYFQLFLCFRMADADVRLVSVLAAAPLLTIARLFPFALNGLGTDETVIAFLFGSAGATNEQALIAALLYRLILIIIPGLAGLCVINLTKRIRSEASE
jgi:uncharacterized membrane protein YbhN (UPF0104 family)